MKEKNWKCKLFVNFSSLQLFSLPRRLNLTNSVREYSRQLTVLSAKTSPLTMKSVIWQLYSIVFKKMLPTDVEIQIFISIDSDNFSKK